jgi:hypothetical protein
MTPPIALRPTLLAFALAVATPFAARTSHAAEAAPPVITDDEVGVLRLFDEFVSSGAAASQCTRLDDYAAARFLSNFQWVSSHATREIGRQLPDSPADAVSAELARRSKAVKDRTHAMVRAEGCEAPGVQQLVQRFAIQAAWKREN